MASPGIKNLRPIRKGELSTKEAKQRGSKGGKASGKARKEKKLMSQIYADMLADQSGIKGGKGFKEVVREILNSTDPKTTAARVSLMKEVREATEGSKLQTETTLNINTEDLNVADILARHGVNKTKD